VTYGVAVGGVCAHVQFFFTTPAKDGGKIGEPRRVKPTEMTRNARNDLHPHPFYASFPSTKTFLQAHLSMFGTLHTTGIPPPRGLTHCTRPCHENAEVTQRSLYKGKALIVRVEAFHKESC
jgi:hypothetical protein